MSATLVAAIPLLLLAIVALLGFVGCVVPEYHVIEDFTTYSPHTVLANPNCRAYWQLNDPAGSVKAKDSKAGNDGDYLNPDTAPALYPWDSASFGDPSAAAGKDTFELGQPGIVIGDMVPETKNLQPCMIVNGALVRVPNASVINPQPEFTVEAWVSVAWSATDEAAQRAVLNCHDINPVVSGFAILAEVDATTTPPTYRWNAEVGNGGVVPDGFTILGATSDPIVLNDPNRAAGPAVYYLALTFDGTTLKFFINGALVDQAVTAYVANATQPLFIGAGAPFEPLRTQPPTPGAIGPLFPFNGAIQDVAIYNKALAATDIALHNANGLGKAVPS